MRLDGWRAQGHTLNFRGHEVFCRVGGPEDAPALLLVHGFPTCSWDWAPLWDELTASWRVLTLDMLGFGLSAKPRDIDYTFALQADLQEHLLERHDVQEVVILAHDYGDTVTQEMLARHEERAGAGLRIRGICLLNGGMFIEAARPRPIQKLLLGPLGPVASALMNETLFRRSFSAVFAPETVPSPDELHDFWRAIAHNGGHRIAHKLGQYLRERHNHRRRYIRPMQTTRVPLRFICGMMDPVSGATMARRYLELLPEPDLIELEAVGHYPQVEAPRAVLDHFTHWAETRVTP